MAQWAMSLAGAAAVAFAGLMVVQRSLYASAICLLLVLLQAGVFFFFSGAPLLAFLQVMISAGAVMVLVVVTIVAAPVPVEERWSSLSLPWPLAAAGLLLPLVELLLLVRGAPSGGPLGDSWAIESRLGKLLFGSYGAATEAVTLLLFVAALAIVEDRREAK